VWSDVDLERIRSLATKVLAPARPSLVSCLSQITKAHPERVKSALEVDPKDKFKAALSLVVSTESRWEGPATGREAWETIAPVQWLNDERRRFERGGEAPATVRDAVTLACDPSGVSTAEALARSFASRCHRALETGRAGEQIAWRFVEPRRFRARFCARSQQRSGEEVFNAICGARRDQGGREARSSALPPEIAAELDALRARLMRRVGPSSWDVVATLQWHSRLVAFEIPSPFDELIALWETGYALDELGDERTVLAAPSV
jgi:hypothetical protein